MLAGEGVGAECALESSCWAATFASFLSAGVRLPETLVQKVRWLTLTYTIPAQYLSVNKTCEEGDASLASPYSGWKGRWPQHKRKENQPEQRRMSLSKDLHLPCKGKRFLSQNAKNAMATMFERWSLVKSVMLLVQEGGQIDTRSTTLHLYIPHQWEHSVNRFSCKHTAHYYLTVRMWDIFEQEN